jgi:hypothetical protein
MAKGESGVSKSYVPSAKAQGDATQNTIWKTVDTAVRLAGEMD